MALTDIPTIKEIKDRIVSDVESKINQTIPPNLLSFVRVLAGAIASPIRLIYGLLVWIYKQIFPQTQSIESLRLEGEAIGVYYKTATNAIVSAAVGGTAPFVDSGQTFYGENQIVYRVLTTTAIPGIVNMVALTSGTIGNLTAGDELILATSAPGVNGVAIVDSMYVTANDDEDIEEYRNRVIIRKKTKFIYGSPAGYSISGLEAPNFIWVGPYADPLLPGNVNVYGRVDLSLGTDGIPTGAQLIELDNFLRYDNGVGNEVRRPINDILSTLPIVNNEFDIIISVQNVSLQLKSEIETAVSNKVSSYEPYIEGVTQTRNDTMTETDIAVTGDTIAAPDGGKIISVSLFDVTGGVFFRSYTFLGNVFGKARNISFVDIV